MKKLYALLLCALAALSLCFPVLGEATPVPAIDYSQFPRIPVGGKNVEVIPGERYILDVPDPSLYEWESSNPDVATIWDNGTFIPFGAGKTTLTGTPKEAGGETVKASISVTIPYVSSTDIVIDTPEGEELITCFGSGIITTNYTGDNCFRTEDVDNDLILSETIRILPEKEGKGAIVYRINGRKTIKVNITVTASAFMSEEERNRILEQAGENARMATVTKGVNLRAEATSDSARVGHADQGEQLVVTQAYYTDKWHQILYDGALCYVSANYVTLDEE